MSRTQTQHTCGGPLFGRLTPGCARCDELISGAAPVQWSKPRYDYNRESITERLCLCPDTPLWVDRCPICGKRQYTD